MDEPAAAADASSASKKASSRRGRASSTAGTAQSASTTPDGSVIAPKGDLILAVTFENSKSTVRAARKAQSLTASLGRAADKASALPPAPKAQARTRVTFRVETAALRGQSKYFAKLLGDSGFKEANDIADALAALSLRGVKPAEADPAELPCVEVTDDDEATQYAHRELVFADLLRILHGQLVAAGTTPAAKVTPQYVTTLAVLADRFDCTAAVSSYVNTSLKFKWPITSRNSGRGTGDDSPGLSRAAEDVLRQKILVGWLLNQPVKFQAGTRELIMCGSSRWSSFAPEDDPGHEERSEASWWYLPEGLEEELQYRRQCVLNTVASIQQHFLSLYSSRSSPRQCKLGYDSSAACDSYQLGEMLRFLANKSLLYLVDFSPGSFDRVADTSQLGVDSLLATLRQCPAYQIDKNHNNCGLRTRLLPILDFVQGLLSSNAAPVSRKGWEIDRAASAWLPLEQDGAGYGAETGSSGHTNGTTATARGGGRPEFTMSMTNGDDGSKGHSQPVSSGGHPGGKPFRFTRTMASDQRLRFEGNLAADKFARQVFLASSWDWTADDDSGGSGPGGGGTWTSPGKMGRMPSGFK